MDHGSNEKRISQLGDVELVRLLTLDASENSPEVIALATAEANRRGLPIDEGFIPSLEDQRASTGDEANDVSASNRFAAGGVPIRGLTFLNLDWLNRSATALVCARCGHIQLFEGRPVAIDDRE